DVDFGYTTADPAAAILGDRIWSDADGDGVQDPGEPGVGGVTVELRDGSGAVVATAVTADDGSYLFTGVAPGEYRARVAPSNFGGGGPLDDYTVTQGPQSEGADISAPVTLAPGDVVTDVDFGYRNDAGTYSIRDAVWLDRDSDGVFDGDDSGIPGVTVNLLDASGDVVATAITAEDGGFSFDGVEPGDYTISVADNGGELIGLGGTTPPGVARSLAVAVVAADVVGENFGYNGDSLLGDRIWSDADGDGVQDPNESGLAGVTVELLDRSGAVIGSAVTDAFGNYVFDGIVPDQYSVRVVTATLPAGFTQTGDPDAALDGQGSALLDLGDAALDLDFGYRNPSLADVSGNVFADLDLDGVDDGAGEPGFLGVTVALLDASGNVIATTKTDGNGDYVFPDLPPGDYSVSVLDDQNVLADHRLTSGSDTLSVTLGATDITGLDFGYARDSATGVIGDRVWLDADGDGVQDGAETGLGGVTVELYDPGPDGAVGGGDDVLLATAVTDANGNYAFTGLAPGIYYAQMDTSTLPGGGADLVATTPDPTGLIPLSEGEIYPDADFGVGSAPGSGAIGDRVWFDADGDGVQDPGEVGIGGVGIELTGPGCAPCTTVTAADGSYLFTGLAPGDYKVDFDPATLPALYDPAPTNTDGHWDVDGLTGGTVVTNADFGFSAAGAVGSIGDLVWNDLDGDGVLDPGEPGIGGVTIDLLDAAGTTVLASTTTAPDGSYDFLGLAAGTYQVRVTDTADVLSGLNLSAGTDPTGPIPLAAGQDYDDADFGYAPSGGAGSIGNLVWHDVDGDGARDPGEPGMEGITLDLWLDVDGNGVIEPGVDNRVRTTVTDANGEYVFNGLPDGDYLVDVTDAAGVLDGFTKTVGAPDTNDNSQADPYAVTVAGGSVEVADFGYRAGSNADILGTTFFDLDANGLEDGADFGVDQVEVFLFRDLDGDGALDPEDPRIGVTTVDANGDYIFEDLPPGDYLVAVDAGGTFVDGADQTTQLFTSSIQPVTLAAVDSTDNDFGFNRTATLALVVDVRRVRAEGRSFIVWSTAAESGTAGFRVHVGAEGAAVPLDPFMAAPLGAPQGADYRVEAPESVGPMVVQLEEIERSGASRLHGPFVLGLEVEEAETAGRDRRPALGLSVHGETFAASPRRPTLAGPDRSAPQALPRTGVTGDRLRLRVEEGGLAFVDLQTLTAGLGVDPAKVRGDLAAAALRLRRGSVDVAYLPVDGGLYFVGRPIEDQVYTSAEVYWLEPGRGVHMETVTTAPSAPTSGGTFDASVHLEENVFAGVSVARDPEVDYWHWKGVIAGHPTLGSAEVTLVAPDVDPSAPSRLRIRLRGAGATVFEDEHHARFEVDGQEVGETRFDGLDDHIATVDLPPGALRDG
ncbi:MAG: SdrD B-like domain-containing protein, partial [Acidobacteriota bacterium]